MKAAKEAKGVGVLFVREIPVDLRNQFKAVCAGEGESMTAVLMRFIQRVASTGKIPSK